MKRLNTWCQQLHQTMFVLSIDPGKNCGTAYWECDSVGNYHQIWVKNLTKEELFEVLKHEPIDYIVYEGYRLYANMAKTMIGNDFETPQIIGVIKFIASERGIPTYMQMATAKKIWTDDRLRHMGLYCSIDHRRDAIRHFLNWYYITMKYGDKRDLIKKEAN